MIWTVALAPFATAPSWHVTVGLVYAQVPWEGVAESKTMLAGRVSVTLVEVGAPGPELCTVRL